jgi:hypothetical protein
MKTIKLILLFVSAFLLHAFSNAQSKVSYGYDLAGNRISRTIVVQSLLRSGTEEPQEEPATYSEVLSELMIRIYPNPTQGLLHIEIENLPTEVKAQVALYHLSGTLVTVKEDVSRNTEIDITQQEAGIYLLKILAGEQQTEWKIIKK